MRPGLIAATAVLGLLVGCGAADPTAQLPPSVPPDTGFVAPSDTVSTEPITPTAATSAAPASSPSAPLLATGEGVQIGGMYVSPSTLTDRDGKVCTNVAYDNRGGAAALASPFDWRLQGPSGAIVAPIPAVGEFLAAEVPAGESVSGTLCFPGEDSGSTYRVIYLAPPPSADVAVFAEQR
jgi:hypothetical protein